MSDADCLNKNQLLKKDFVPLFNGKNLAGWKVPKGDNGHWKVIDYDALSQAKADKNLWTVESFENFVLHLEWRFKRTSGSGFHSSPLRQPSYLRRR